MKLKFGLLSAGALALALGFAAPAWSAGYLKIGDIKGESTDTSHKGEIEILSWSWGETNAGASAGMATGKRQHKPLVITKQVDKASPLLQRANASGKAIDTMEVTLPSKSTSASGEQMYLKYKLQNVYVTSYQTGASGASDTVPTETFSLNYEEIKQVYDRTEKKARTEEKATYKTKDEGDR